MKTLPVKFEVQEISMKGHSLLVLPNCESAYPHLSIQMRTDLARKLAYSANVLPELADAAQDFLYTVLATGGAKQEQITRLQSALADAQWT